jgi:hypothetical protein
VCGAPAYAVQPADYAADQELAAVALLGTATDMAMVVRTEWTQLSDHAEGAGGCHHLVLGFSETEPHHFQAALEWFNGGQ